jgi:pantothenate kinase
MVALCGVPGSGKTISSTLLAKNLQNQHGIDTMVMSHDGYDHYPLEYPKTLPNAKDAIYRRGAPDTFDAPALWRDLRRIMGCKNEDKDSMISAPTNANNDDDLILTLPGFDHAKGDPEPNVHTFDRARHQVVICEGLYLLHDKDGWQDVASIFDLTVFIDANVNDCIDRLKIRNQCIPGYTPQEICLRCETVDRANAMIVVQSKRRAHVTVPSVTTTTTTTTTPAAASVLCQEKSRETRESDDSPTERSNSFDT